MVPFSSIQRVFLECSKTNKNTIPPFDFNLFNPMGEIDLIKAKIIEFEPSLDWSKDEYELPDEMCDEDLNELYSAYNYMIIEKIKKKVYKRQ